MISASDSSSKTSATPIARIHLHRGEKNLFIRPELIRSSSRLGTIFGSYIFTSISLCHAENLAGKYHLYFRALATINPIGQFFIKTNSSSYFSPYKHFWNYLKLDPIPFALKESLQYLVTWEDHMPKSRHRNRQPFFYVLNSRATFQSTEQV